MNINNGFNILPWHNSLEKQNCKKWYAYGQAWPLLCPQGFILPFQFISDTAITISSNIYAISVETGQTIDLGVKPTVTEINRADITYYIVKLVSTSIVNLPIGRYNHRMNTSEGFLYSEELVVINNANECIKVEYWNEDTLKFTSGEINFTDDFHFIFYINSTIGKPEYEFEEELTKRLGYKFIESQTSNKVYKFSFVAPEYICDAMRLIRMCDYIKLTTKFDSYNALSFAYEPKWQEQGDLAAVDVEFDTDCIIQKLESFNRRAKESFYNALLADIDEPVLFSTDTVAQYYTEYTASGTISGKLIRQLTAISEDELVSSLSSIVLPVDNQSDNSQVAKKAFLSDIVNKLIPKVNLSEYLLKSVWDKVFEIRTDRQGKEYIFGKLPVVTQYGITMYADGGAIDLPSLYAGLPIDGKTLIRDEKGVLMVNPDIELGGGVSNFWDLSGTPSWITSSKPKYTYSEIVGTPDLSGYATESWVLGKSYITSATLGTELAKYVTLDTDQPLKGKKDFKNGLSIDGLEIRKSQDDVVYIDANLVVRGGVTMYAQNEVDIPSIIDSIPTASTTVKGIASFDGAYFSVVNGKVSLIASNVGLNEEELYNYLTSNNYAKKTDIPSLVGYATQSWVNTRIDSLINGAPAAYDTLKEIADVLQGNVNSIGDIITALGTKWTQDNTKIANWDTAYSWGNHANVGYALKSYVDSTFVTLGSTQTITGEKNFTGGLKVNGSHIYYDTEKKYWKLEGDLLVTGGVTMYGSDSSFTPSTIMDAIAVDGTTISKSGGVLKVIGGTGGGVADSVAWANITGKPTFATVATSGKYSDLSGTPSSLPASDVYSWAKSATKPTYTWSEITSKPTWIGSSKPTYSYSEITGAISTTELQNYLTQNSYLNVKLGDNRYSKLSAGTLTSSSVPLYLDRTDSTNSYTLIGYRNTSKDLGYLGFSNYGDLVVSPNRQNGNTNYYTIWHSGNDGSGSGLDADKLDGIEYQNILERGYSGVTRCSGVGWHRIGEFKGTDSNIILLIHRLYGNNAPESYAFSITRVMGTDNYCITQLSGTYSTQVITSIRIDIDWDKNGYIDFYYNTTLGNSVCWTIIGGATAYTAATFNPTTLSVQKTITPIKGFQTSGDILSHGGVTMYSMRSLKNVVDERGLSLSELSTIKPTRYTWKDDRDNRLHIGGIADDIQQVLPEVVYKTSDGILTMDYGNAAFAVASSLIQPVVNHEKRIAMLEEENKELRNEIERLKSA